jgi:hypothetical protein
MQVTALQRVGFDIEAGAPKVGALAKLRYSPSSWV